MFVMTVPVVLSVSRVNSLCSWVNLNHVCHEFCSFVVCSVAVFPV